MFVEIDVEDVRRVADGGLVLDEEVDEGVDVAGGVQHNALYDDIFWCIEG